MDYWKCYLELHLFEWPKFLSLSEFRGISLNFWVMLGPFLSLIEKSLNPDATAPVVTKAIYNHFWPWALLYENT